MRKQILREQKIDPRDYNHLIGKVVLLPSGESVQVFEVRDDATASVRRIDGERAGTVTLCDIEQLISDE